MTQNDSTFTPGPWFHDLVSENNRYQVYDENYKPVAVITGQKGSYKANARLIAAAPDQHEALRAAVEWWDTVPKTLNVMIPDWVEPARAALAKVNADV